MGKTTLDDHLDAYLADAHSIEEQALAQLRSAPEIAGNRALGQIFQQHLLETEEQERLIRERLEARGAKPAAIKEAVMKLGGKGFVLFARSQPDTPGKLMAHAYSYEALELASYEALARVADRAEDDETAAVARRIRGEEAAMMVRIEGAFEGAVDASLQAKGSDDLRGELVKYLADAHAIENQALGLLGKAREIGGDPELEQLYAQHEAETEQHQRLVRERLEAHDAGPSKLKDVGMKVGAFSWGGFFAAHPDTPGKLAAFAFAFEHLEMGGYEQLRRVARRAGDDETAALADRILAEERATAGRISDLFDRGVAASLQAQGVLA